MPLYHVWFSTKNRKWLLQGDVATKAKQELISVATEKRIELLECETMVDHVHLLLAAASATELSWHLKLLKGRSSYEVFKAYPEVKLDAQTNALWQVSFNSRVVPDDQVATVRHYIRTQDQRLEKYER